MNDEIHIARAKLDDEGLYMVPKDKASSYANESIGVDRLAIDEIILGKYKDALDKDKNFWQRIGAFLSASTVAGRKAKAIKDFALLFFPWGKQVSTLTEFITERFIKPQQTDNTMKQTKKKRQSKTWWGILTTVLASLLGAYGIAADPSFLNDGFQLANDLEMLIAFVGVIAGWALERWGQRTADKKIQ